MDDVDYNYIKSTVRNIPDYPNKGIMFRDITTLLKDKRALSICIDELADWVREKDIDYLVGIEARGFIIGADKEERQTALSDDMPEIPARVWRG